MLTTEKMIYLVIKYQTKDFNKCIVTSSLDNNEIDVRDKF